MRFVNTLNPNLTADVVAFHTAFDQLISNHPTIPSDKELALSKDLIREEVVHELFGAIDRKDLPDIVDAAIDSVYVIVGMLVRMGVPFNPFWHEVQHSNMTKIGGHKAPNGKWIKPSTYTPAEIKGLLEYLGWQPPMPASASTSSTELEPLNLQGAKHPDYPFVDPNYKGPNLPIQKEGRHG